MSADHQPSGTAAGGVARPDVGRRPASAARVEANRLNARRSTGPRSAAGKARSARNAVRHGAFAAGPLLLGESAADYVEHVADVAHQYGVADEAEAAAVSAMADATWRMRRFATPCDNPRDVLRTLAGEDRLTGRFLAAARRLERIRFGRRGAGERNGAGRSRSGMAGSGG